MLQLFFFFIIIISYIRPWQLYWRLFFWSQRVTFSFHSKIKHLKKKQHGILFRKKTRSAVYLLHWLSVWAILAVAIDAWGSSLVPKNKLTFTMSTQTLCFQCKIRDRGYFKPILCFKKFFQVLFFNFLSWSIKLTCLF